MSTSTTRRRRSAAVLAFAAALTVLAPVVEARPGGGGSFGSRGSKTFNAPSATTTAPSAAPIQRTQTPQPGPGMGNPGMQAPAAQGRRFGGGFFAGLLGAGLLGALLGGGFFGGLGGIASFLGLLLQVGLVVLLVSFAVRWFRRRQAGPATAGAAPSYARTGMDSGSRLGGAGGNGLGGMGFGGIGGSSAGAAQSPVQTRAVKVAPEDFQAFERLLGKVQDAFSREDMADLRVLATPEMAGYFDEELRENASRGVINRISDVNLLQGDLSEAWAEGNLEYATVAMRYALNDAKLDRKTNRVVEAEPAEATELWTFVRGQGHDWTLSAIQQTGR